MSGLMFCPNRRRNLKWQTMKLTKFTKFDGKISTRFDHDVSKLVAHYQALEREYRKSGKYKFVDPPNEKRKIEKSKSEEAAD